MHMRRYESYELTEEDFYPPQDDRVLTSDFEYLDDDGYDCKYSDYGRWYYAEYGDDLFGDGWEN